MTYHPIIKGCVNARIRQALAVAVDIGFSKAGGHSTGFATDSSDYTAQRSNTTIDDGLWHENLSFAEAIHQTEEVFRRLPPAAPAVLIVEAPLSERFDTLGNPTDRGTFERSSPWYHRAGALTALAACYFLKKLAENLHDLERTIHLIEGFVTGNLSGNHRIVARNLLRAWRGGGGLIEPVSQISSLTALPGYTADAAAPSVLMLNEDNNLS